MSKKLKAVTRDDLLKIFSAIDQTLSKQHQTMVITAIGGVAIIMQKIVDRVTLDIDIAHNNDAVAFQHLCEEFEIPVDIVTVATTVDLVYAEKVELFRGKALTVNSVTTTDLIKLKLERFRKQDPEDIYAIIEKTKLPYDTYKALVQDMLLDYIGNPRELLLSALIVIERMYPEKREDFKVLFDK